MLSAPQICLCVIGIPLKYVLAVITIITIRMGRGRKRRRKNMLKRSGYLTYRCFQYSEISNPAQSVHAYRRDEDCFSIKQ
jgi:hypothetical protein